MEAKNMKEFEIDVVNMDKDAEDLAHIGENCFFGCTCTSLDVNPEDTEEE